MARRVRRLLSRRTNDVRRARTGRPGDAALDDSSPPRSSPLDSLPIERRGARGAGRDVAGCPAIGFVLMALDDVGDPHRSVVLSHRLRQADRPIDCASRVARARAAVLPCCHDFPRARVRSRAGGPSCRHRSTRRAPEQQGYRTWRRPFCGHHSRSRRCPTFD